MSVSSAVVDGLPATQREYFRPADAAEFLGVSEVYLEKLRAEGRGPVFKKPGRRVVVYSRSALIAWMEHQATGGGR